MAGALWSGRRFPTFNVNDDFNRESLRIEIDTNLPSRRVVRALDELAALRSAPQRLRPDNGPEFISTARRQWAERHGVALLHIQPGKPTQSADFERFNQTFRTEILDRYAFTSLQEVPPHNPRLAPSPQPSTPHRSLGGLPPVAYAMASSTRSTSE